MKYLAKLTLTASAIIAISTHLSLANTTEYRLVALDDCEVVAEHALNQNQIDAYLALKASEQAMEQVTMPIDALEDDIERYTSKISDLTSRAIQEQGDTVTINRALLAEQEAVAKELEAMLARHQADFDAIEQEAQVIETHARQFEQAIQPLLDSTDHDTVRIVGPKSNDAPYSCDSNHAMLIM